MTILHTFLHLFHLSVKIEQVQRGLFQVVVETPCDAKYCDENHKLASLTGKDLDQTMLKCFLKVVDMQGEAPETLQAYRDQLNNTYKRH